MRLSLYSTAAVLWENENHAVMVASIDSPVASCSSRRLYIDHAAVDVAMFVSASSRPFPVHTIAITAPPSRDAMARNNGFSLWTTFFSRLRSDHHSDKAMSSSASDSISIYMAVSSWITPVR